MAKTLRLVESQELEEGALVIFELHLELDGIGSLSLEWLDASVILPYKSLELGRSIGQL